MFTKILYFFFFVSLGVTILKYRKIVFEWTGQWYWAEKHLGRGGTILIITLIGLGMIFFGVGYPFGAFENFGKKGGGVDLSQMGVTGDPSSAAPSESEGTQE